MKDAINHNQEKALSDYWDDIKEVMRVEMGKRYKRAEAVAIGWRLVCPYKTCGIGIGGMLKQPPKKGDLIVCPNCSKTMRLTRVR